MCGTSFKFLFITLITIYTSYLFFYKCDQVTGLETILHPLNHHHKSLCEGVYKVEKFVTPYGQQFQTFLDDNVHSTQFFKTYQIHEHLVDGYTQVSEFIHPFATKLFQTIEFLEIHAYEQSIELYNHGLALYKQYVN